MRRTLPCTVRLAGPRDDHDDGLTLKGVVDGINSSQHGAKELTPALQCFHADNCGASNADTGEVGLSGV